MLDTTAAGRLREHVARWVQFVGSLWSGSEDKAVFCLRYRGRAGRVDAVLLASALEHSQEEHLRAMLRVALRSHRILADPSEAEIAEPAQAEWLTASTRTLIEVRQHQNTRIWQPTVEIRRNLEGNLAGKELGLKLPADFYLQPPIVFPWWGPGGPFLLPMECLTAAKDAVMLSIYLQPTVLHPAEAKLLRGMAATAESAADQSKKVLGENAGTIRRADPVSRLVGSALQANLRRLSIHPFLVAVHCSAAAASSTVAEDLAGSMRALVQERPVDAELEKEEGMPTGADISTGEPSQTALRQHSDLRFPLVGGDADPLCRLPYLVDARGAAMVFRLPVSVRGGVPGMVVKQLPPDFNPGPRLDIQEAKASKNSKGEMVVNIILGRLHQGGWAAVPMDDFRKHALVTGFTGSGKTQTLLFLLHQFWTAKPETVAVTDKEAREITGWVAKRPARGPNGGGIPFLVIESAKQEYRGFLGVPEIQKDLLVFTLGNETCAPLRLNPFELQEGVRVETHISRLQTCFEGALPMVGPLQSVLIEALVRVYDDPKWNLDRRWRLTETFHEEDRLGRRFPTMSEFYNVAEQVIRDRKYQGDVQSNVLAAITGRLKPLTRRIPTSVSRMLDTDESTPFDQIFSGPTVLELNDLNEQEKCLTVMFLLTMLREYRETNATKYLDHVTVVEEAHNVLAEVGAGHASENASDTRQRAVQSFCQMLTEIRALGEGLIIADQSPEKLAADAMRNTNVQIAHQLRDSRDREAVARALLMTEEQRDFVGKLQPGHAAVFYTGLERATFVTVPHYMEKEGKEMAALGFSAGSGFGDFGVQKAEDVVRDHMMGKGFAVAKPELPFGELCVGCDGAVGCGYRRAILAEAAQKRWQKSLSGERVSAYQDLMKRYARAVGKLSSLKDDELRRAKVETEALESEKAKAKVGVQSYLLGQSRIVAEQCGDKANVHLARCAFLHLGYAAGTSGEREFTNAAIVGGFSKAYAELNQSASLKKPQ